jgi:hypothetical protein
MPAPTSVALPEDRDPQIANAMRKYGRLRRIPIAYDNDPRFAYKCAISLHVIRFIVVPKTQLAQPPVYERDVLRDFIAQRPNELPPSWPANLPCREGNYVSSKSKQREINAVLKSISEKLKGSNTLTG